MKGGRNSSLKRGEAAETKKPGQKSGSTAAVAKGKKDLKKGVVKFSSMTDVSEGDPISQEDSDRESADGSSNGKIEGNESRNSANGS